MTGEGVRTGGTGGSRSGAGATGSGGKGRFLLGGAAIDSG